MISRPVHRSCAAPHRLLLLTAAISLLVGCSSHWSYETPPTTSATAAAPASADASRIVIVVSRFSNPGSASVAWRDIGQSMSDALSRSLLGDGHFDVLIIPELSARIDPIVNAVPRANQASELGRVKAAYPNVDFVLTGKVTDFQHTADLSKDVARRGLFGRKSEALVALKLNIVDLSATRVIAVDHIAGTASAGSTPAAELYKGIDFDSYLFWSTPLGQATREVISQTKVHLTKLVPYASGDIRVARLAGPRTIEIAQGTEGGLFDGQEYYLATTATAGFSPVAVVDPDTRQPLRVRLRDVKQSTAVGLVLGKPPADFDAGSAVLLRDLPSGGGATASASTP